MTPQKKRLRFARASVDGVSDDRTPTEDTEHEEPAHILLGDLRDTHATAGDFYAAGASEVDDAFRAAPKPLFHVPKQEDPSQDEDNNDLERLVQPFAGHNDTDKDARKILLPRKKLHTVVNRNVADRSPFAFGDAQPGMMIFGSSGNIDSSIRGDLSMRSLGRPRTRKDQQAQYSKMIQHDAEEDMSQAIQFELLRQSAAENGIELSIHDADAIREEESWERCRTHSRPSLTLLHRN